LWQLTNKLDELILVHQHTPPRVKQNVASALAEHREGEARLIRPSELQIHVLRVGLHDTLLGQVYEIVRQDVLAYVATIEVGGLDGYA